MATTRFASLPPPPAPTVSTFSYLRGQSRLLLFFVVVGVVVVFLFFLVVAVLLLKFFLSKNIQESKSCFLSPAPCTSQSPPTTPPSSHLAKLALGRLAFYSSPFLLRKIVFWMRFFAPGKVYLQPCCVAVGRDERVYVADTGNCRLVKKFNGFVFSFWDFSHMFELAGSRFSLRS